MNKRPHLLTYPRSGSHYFEEVLYTKIGTRIDRSHTIVDVVDEKKDKTKKIITIIRDPEQVLKSTIALQAKFGNKVTEHSIKQALSEYALLHDFLFDHADIVICFNDLINHPELVINKTLEFLNIDHQGRESYSIDDYKKLVSKRYTPSSKDLPDYKEIDLDNFNTGICYYFYNKLLEKKIIINDKD
jgi:hypothetical protein